MLVINLWAGPGAGKSTTAAGLFFKLKSNGVNSEYVQEYAKAVTWEKRVNLLSDQLYILAKQNRSLERLRNQVDVVVTDSPVLLGLNYTLPDYYPIHFKNFTREVWDSYTNLNFVIQREKVYQPIGRNQTEQQARELDQKIITFLNDQDIPYTLVPGNTDAPDVIFKYVQEFLRSK